METENNKHVWVTTVSPSGNIDLIDPTAPQLASGTGQLPPLLHTTEKKLIRKIDYRVVPFPTILLLLCFLDRTNIGNASVYGLLEELHLSHLEYSNALTMFFISYVVFEIPSNILLKKLSPHIWLSLGMFLFGLATLCTGFVKNYSGLLALRFLLGVSEAGMIPGSAYLMGAWYKRCEAQRRFSFFFSAICFAGATGGLLAAGIGKMDGLCGYAGWRWIFIIEGMLSCIVGIIFFFWIADFPEDAKWLTEEERDYVKARVRAEQGCSDFKYSIRTRDIWNTLKDPKVLIGGLMHFSEAVPGYTGAFFAPSIISGFGYSQIGTQLHTVPPWAFAFVFSLTVAYVSDKLQQRYTVALFCTLVSLTGFCILLTIHDNLHVQYGALFLAFGGIQSFLSIEICWVAMNLGGHRRRAIGTAWQASFGNIGGIVASYAFRPKDAPDYMLAYGLCVGFSGLSAVLASLYAFACWRENRKRAATELEAELREEEKADLGEMSPSYRYLL